MYENNGNNNNDGGSYYGYGSKATSNEANTNNVNSGGSAGNSAQNGANGSGYNAQSGANGSGYGTQNRANYSGYNAQNAGYNAQNAGNRSGYGAQAQNSGYSSYNGSYNRGYNGYNPYQPPQQQKPPKKKKNLVWLWILLGVLTVITISAVSIGIYSASTRNAITDDEPIEWSIPEEELPEGADEEYELSEGKSESIASEGTSDKYALKQSSPRSGDMSPEEVAEKLIPSVVCVQNYQTISYSQNYGFGYGGYDYNTNDDSAEDITLYGEGSGIIITSDGYISTNAHVVSGAKLLKVILSDDTVYEAKLVGIDSSTDLAVIKIDAKGLTPADLGSANDLKVGQYVMAIGNPGGHEFSSSVTLGIVSAVNRPLTLSSGGYTMNTIQTDAAINPGNSGGALVNLSGQVVGVCSAKYVAEGYEGLGFAITIDEALPIIKNLMDYGEVKNRSMLGITGVLLDEMNAKYYNLCEGYYVYSVSNPNAGGLASGDVITEVNGTAVTAETNIKDIIKDMAPGEKVSIKFYRSSDDQMHSTVLTLVEYTEDVK